MEGSKKLVTMAGSPFGAISRERPSISSLFPSRNTGSYPRVILLSIPTVEFNQAIRETDLLWTKPSELSFFCGLGIPIIMAPSIGSQEDFNRKWLLEVQAGIPQEDPAYAHQWLTDLLTEGRLAESAWDGFLKARKYGTYKIRELLETGTMARETSPLKR